MDEAPQIYLVILTTLICSAFFSGMEIAFVSSNKLKIELDKKQGLWTGRILSYFVKNTGRFISAMLLGNNISLVVYGIFMAVLLEPLFLQLSENAGLVLLLQTIVSTLIVLVTAEFLPKALFRINPNRTLIFGAIPLVIVYGLLFIPTVFVMGVSSLFLRLMNVDTDDSEVAFSKVDLDDYVRDLNERSDDKVEMDNEIQILHNALEFSSIKARECMIPRTEMVAMNIEDEIKDVKAKFIETGLSKILIYRDSFDNIIGYVHAYELFSQPESIKQMLLPIDIVPEAVLVKNLLEQFTRKKRSIAVVVDEFGGTSGLITVEDIIEEIFGEIKDEHDISQNIEEQIDEKTFVFAGRTEIDYLNDEFNFDFNENEEYDTLAGYVIHELEDIPEEGAFFENDNYAFTVTQVSESKIDLVKIEKKEKQP